MKNLKLVTINRLTTDYCWMKKQSLDQRGDKQPYFILFFFRNETEYLDLELIYFKQT